MASDAEILLRTGLAAAGVPAQFTGQIVTQFRGCLHDRLVVGDPTATPRSCTPTGAARSLPAAANRVLAAGGGSAVRDDFAASLQRTLWFQVGAFLLSFLLMLALPAGAGRRSAEGNAPGREALSPGSMARNRGSSLKGRGRCGFAGRWG